MVENVWWKILVGNFGGKILEEMPYLISLNPLLLKNICNIHWVLEALCICLCVSCVSVCLCIFICLFVSLRIGLCHYQMISFQKMIYGLGNTSHRKKSISFGHCPNYLSSWGKKFGKTNKLAKTSHFGKVCTQN